ncbi:MAG: YbjN domain-containing protein [Propionibacteriaceae bacterium]|nr:YbjN domain-containing protein [Propionibacteriaceae bacterium]
MTDEFNFDQSVEQAWKKFAVRLAAVLSMMDETEALVLRSSGGETSQDYVTFTRERNSKLTARVPSELHHQLLSPDHIATLVDAGWQEQAGEFVREESQEQTEILSVQVVDVLRMVFGLDHPVFVHSNVLDDVLTEPVVVEGLHGEDMANHDTGVTAYRTMVELEAAIHEELAEILGTSPMKDHDGDFAIRVGSAMIFIRLTDDGQEIRLFSVLVHDITGRSRAAEVLNDVNSHSRWVRFSLVRDKIIAVLSLYAVPFVPAHLRFAVEEMATVADGVDDLLAASLQGKTTFPDNNPEAG